MTPATLREPPLLNDSVSRYGVSETAAELQQQMAEAQSHFREPITNREPSLAERFAELAHQWREDTGFLSSSTALFMHPAYQQIIGMGPAVLPLLLQDLAATRTH